jgi:hypothetical protein
MKIYCSHVDKIIHKKSNYVQCRLCLQGWYTVGPTPIVVIGYTDPMEVDSHYLDHLETNDLSKKKFMRCGVCHDLVEKRKHIKCAILVCMKIVAQRHLDTLERIRVVLRGFWK